jgi:outer membrane protein
MKSLFKILCIAFIAFISFQADAQNYAYMDSAALLGELPEVKQADATLATRQKQLQKQGQQMVQDLQARYQELSKMEQQGNIAPKDLQAEAEKLKEREMEISEFEQNMQQQLTEKRQELLEPILNRVQTIIDNIAAEEGYTYIFDSSTGILLYADESKDITEKVKSRLQQ